MAKAVRLDKFLADAGKGTRSEVKKYIQKGQVQVNGQTVKKPEHKVLPEIWYSFREKMFLWLWSLRIIFSISRPVI